MITRLLPGASHPTWKTAKPCAKKWWTQVCYRPGLLLCLNLAVLTVTAEEHPLEELRTAEQVRKLTPEQAARHYPVHLHGVVTVFDQSLFSRIIQDNTAGIYLADPTNLFPLVPGQIVDVRGVTSPGEYAPIIMPNQFVVQGTGPFPPAKLTTFEQLASGQEDSQFVEVRGVVRATHVDEQTQHQLIEIATGGGRLTAYVSNIPSAQLGDLVDGTVRVRGVCVTLFNRQRQLFHIRLLVPRPEDLVIEQTAGKDQFSIPAQNISSLLQFSPEGTYGHRVKIAGTVVYQNPGSTLFVQDGKEGLFVQTKQDSPVRPGDQVEVLGFPAKGEYTPMLQDAVYRKTGSGQEPTPDSISVDEALKGTHDSRLVRIEAVLLDRAQQSHEQILVLGAEGLIFHAHLEKDEAAALEGFQNGSKVAITGICLIEPGSEWQAGELWRAKSFRLMLRSPADVVVLKAPPWWTLGKLLWAVGILGVIVLGAFAWVAVLRRRVHAQTNIIRQKLQIEATLKERYEELFENANDMVYTHDLNGRITSLNQTGERLLQRSREEVLQKSLVELITGEQQAAAQSWLEHVVKGTAPATAEWDFLSARGERIKLEISTRLIGEEGRKVEVEGIARNITERKRLEREILEISNREQRRIGHDLHDGVCQQLAGIAFMTATLADSLQEKGDSESAQAERISTLLNAAINQTRGVARGLFPVRLEENGLVSALEELAANASELFKIKCRFASEEPPSGVENEIALHLYYIVLESVANAAKHGKARNISITLEPAGNRYELSVRDDGIGFSLAGGPHIGMGIRIMHYRARVIGASLSLHSEPGWGTHVTCLFHPVSRESSHSVEAMKASEASNGRAIK